jgi:hypothetical protein
MTEKLISRFERTIAPQLTPDERLLDVAVIQPVAGVRGSVEPAGVMAETLVLRVGAMGGGTTSLADRFPAERPFGVSQRVLWVSDRRVGLTGTRGGREPGALLWAVPRAWVVRVERRPRVQTMTRFRLHFADGSFVAALTMRRRTVESLADLLGR